MKTGKESFAKTFWFLKNLRIKLLQMRKEMR